MSTLQITLLRIFAIFWALSSAFGLLNADNVFSAGGVSVGLAYTLAMALLLASNVFLIWASVRGRTPDDLFLLLHGVLNIGGFMGFMVLRFFVLPDLYSMIATSTAQMNLLLIMFAATAFLSLWKNETLNVKRLFERLPEQNPEDDPTYIDPARYERFNRLLG